MRRRRGWLNVEGCGFIVVTSLLLVMNAILLVVLCGALGPLGPAWMSHPKFAQTVALVGSLALVFVQWWAIDKITARWFPRRGNNEEDPP